MAQLTLLHTNDLHGRLSDSNVGFLQSLRGGADFDSGDCARAGNLSAPLKEEACWKLLASVPCDAMVPGNRESHPLEVGGGDSRCKTPVVCANWRTRGGSLVFPPSLVLEKKEVRVGVFGVMVAMVTARMKSQAISAYLWDPAIEAAVEAAKGLRSECDLVVALTHIGIAADRRLAEACGEIDLILGWRSHTVIAEPELVNGVPICQGGSHAHFVGRYVLEVGHGLVSAELLPWQ